MSIDQRTYQCPETKTCANSKCFWWQRDNLQRSAFPCYPDENGNWPAIDHIEKIEKAFGKAYFPDHEVNVGTNCMYITCKDYKSK